MPVSGLRGMLSVSQSWEAPLTGAHPELKGGPEAS